MYCMLLIRIAFIKYEHPGSSIHMRLDVSLCDHLCQMFLIYSVNPQRSFCVDQYSVIMFIVHRQTVNMTLGVQMFANSTVIHSVIN